MKFENTETFGWGASLRGMRNPKESWNRNDTVVYNSDTNGRYTTDESYVLIGSNDMDLATRLIKAGTEHRKFLRMIHVQVDMTAPLYLWKEYDTYKIATVANSESTMHRITSKPITLEYFETDDMKPFEKGYLQSIIDMCEDYRLQYLETKDKDIWKALIRLLPESWLQTRTIDLNYETLRTIYHQRKFHKLSEWHTFCDWVKTLPYAKEFITDGE